MAEPGDSGRGAAPRRRKARGGSGDRDPGGEPKMRQGYARAEEKNRLAREALTPLDPGERPGPVTVGAVLSTLVAVILWASCAVAIFTGAEVNGEPVNLTQWIFFAAIVTLMAWGMWRARYWAVLGFQMSLVLLIIAGVLGLVMAGTVLQLVGTALLVTGLSVLFWFMVKAMARVQMPRRDTDR